MHDNQAKKVSWGADEERLLVFLVNTKLLLHTNQDTKVFPSIISSLLKEYVDLFLE